MKPAAGLLEAARAAFWSVAWSEFYAEDEWSRPFLSRFATGEGIGPGGAVLHRSIVLGLFVLGPDADYPAHAHPAEEVYVGLAGSAGFEIGDAPARRIDPGALALHRSDVAHAIRTGSDAFFAVYAWRGEIGGRSWWRKDMTDASEPKRYPRRAEG